MTRLTGGECAVDALNKLGVRHCSAYRACSLTRNGGTSGDVVTLIQRFGGAVNLHLHMFALDGVYTRDGETPRFHEVSAPSSADMQRLLDVIVARVLRCLERDGLLIREPEQPWLDLESRDALDTLGAASIQYRIAVGSQAGRKALALKQAGPRSPSMVPTPFTVARDGFSLNAAVAFAADQREGIERLCRYVTRPASALERLSSNELGQVVYQLKTPYRDGTTHFVFEPLDFLVRLAALVPRPRGSLVRYHGTVTTVGSERQASKQSCTGHTAAEASPPRTCRVAGADQSAPRRRRRANRAHDVDGAPCDGQHAECSQSICAGPAASARTAVGVCGSSPT